ncbi:Uncharacterised protein [Legionella lansingensis]|uniref:Transmembrane protein n=1 Tax=Legionella lansingensis TaxID=45067 RepID=A0A0W0VQ06_9GAMM|nr:hypothetical protein [Legionella lansingensis]KTD22206.1 hypothetical protein Llan_1469 [Legionella lansingensis]SNV54994.1 Uncharacterised protein [Legionella lansingensis]
MSNKTLEPLFQQIIPFLIAGIAIALIIALFILFSYVLIWGLVIGGILWLIAVVKHFLFPSAKKEIAKGRIIEHSDKD